MRLRVLLFLSQAELRVQMLLLPILSASAAEGVEPAAVQEVMEDLWTAGTLPVRGMLLSEAMGSR